jgi:hypothetical protein
MKFTALRLPVKRVNVVVASSLCRVCRVCRVCRLYGGVQGVLRRSRKVMHGRIVHCEVCADADDGAQGYSSPPIHGPDAASSPASPWPPPSPAPATQFLA